MIKKHIGLFSIIFFSISCSSEKISLSPMYNTGPVKTVDLSRIPRNVKEKNQELFYASELTNQVSSFPKFKNDAMNKEVGNLKYNVKDYVYAVQEYNLVGRRKALNNIEKSYKKIQKLRVYLNPDDNETINRYLVRVKGNISKLEIINAQNNKNLN